MAQFHYTAAQKNGEIVESQIESESLSNVLRFLTSRGMKPISIKPVKKDRMFTLFQGKVTLNDQIFIFRYLALMLKIGSNLLQAVNILIEDFDKQAVKEFLLEVRANLESGSPFYLAFANHPKIFSTVNVNLIKAGEVSGKLESSLETITESLVREKGLKDEIKNALIYPFLLLGISAFILIFLVTFALPRISGVFLDSGFDPPVFSKIVFSVGLFLGNVWAYLFGAILIGSVVAFYFYRSSLFFRRLLWSFLTETPIVKDIIEKRAIQRFAATTSSLIKAGIAITEALEITADAIGHVKIKEALIRISKEGLAKGATLGDAFKRETVFPKTVINLIAISEKAGHVEDVLATLSDFYVREVSNSLKRLVSLIEPLLLLFIGVIIGVIALSIIVPIYQLTTQF